MSKNQIATFIISVIASMLIGVFIMNTFSGSELKEVQKENKKAYDSLVVSNSNLLKFIDAMVIAEGRMTEELIASEARLTEMNKNYDKLLINRKKEYEEVTNASDTDIDSLFNVYFPK